MKYRHLILILLCLLMGNTLVHAQLFSTSSQEFHSYGGGGGSGYATMPSATSIGGSTMRSTSRFSTSTTISNYSTAPLQIANGSIQTAASNLTGGVLADNTGATTDNTGFIPTDPQRSIAPPDFPNVPLGLDWDAFLLLLALTLLYAFRLYRKRHTTQP